MTVHIVCRTMKNLSDKNENMRLMLVKFPLPHLRSTTQIPGILRSKAL